MDRGISAACDALLSDVADYVLEPLAANQAIFSDARYCLMDAIGCGIAALQNDECRKRLGPVVPGAVLANGVPVIGTAYRLDPVRAAFNIGCMVRWDDFNDTWLAAEWGHPSDNLSAILASADHADRNLRLSLTVDDILVALIKAYEIQGILSLENSFNQLGFDHVILVKIASTAVATALFGGGREQILNALSNAWLDGVALRTYRHAPNTGWRKSWAAGDAAARAVQHALMAVAGEMGYPTALSAKNWGFYDTILSGQPLKISRPLQTYVIENILFKVGFPAEFHAQTAVEAAFQLYPKIAARLAAISKIDLFTQQAAVRIIDKTGKLDNPADRDHCLQYAVAVALVHGEVTSKHYDAPICDDPRIDQLRDKMTVAENPRFSADYLDPEKRAVGNEVVVQFDEGEIIRCRVDYPLGHPRRRSEALPKLLEKFRANIAFAYKRSHCAELCELFLDRERLEGTSASEFCDLLCKHTTYGFETVR